MSVYRTIGPLVAMLAFIYQKNKMMVESQIHTCVSAIDRPDKLLNVEMLKFDCSSSVSNSKK